MRSLVAFLKKEGMEQIRSGRLAICTILFVLFGIMNPAVAKMTPWLMEMFADTLAGSGLTITEVTVSALDSWMQFFKNIPLALIAFVLLQSSIFTKEYSSGTLELSLTKGLGRSEVLLSKTAVLMVLWTVGYVLCCAVTYGYNAYFWENGVAQNLMFSLVCYWLFGVWVISLLVLFSAIANTNSGVLAAVGSVVAGCYLLGFLPKIGKYLPTGIGDGTSLIYGTAEARTYVAAVVITAVCSLLCVAASFPVFARKQL